MSDKRSIKTIIFHGGILAMAGILVRIIGLLYRIPMVNIIGAEANGIYSAAFNVYNLMLVLSSYGLPMAVSKLVSARIENKKFKNAAAVFNMAMAISMVTGGLAGLFCITIKGISTNCIYCINARSIQRLLSGSGNNNPYGSFPNYRTDC